MIGKAILGLVIILGGGYLGMIYASRFDCRVRQLEAFRSALSQLEFDIRFLSLPLTEALDKVAESQNGAVRKIFRETADGLSRKKGARVSALWVGAIEKYRAQLCLTEQDLQAVNSFSHSLGSGDTESEIGNIRAAQMRLQVAEDAARAQAQKNVRLYRGLGLLAGIFAAILLF